MSDTSLRFDFLRGRNTVSSEMNRVANDSTSMAGRIKASSVISVAATATMVAGWASLAAQGVAAVAAVSPLIGLVATIPAVAIAAAGGISTLMLATSGLAAALKQSTGAGVNNSQALVAAERRVESAQQAATRAQVGLNDARQQAADRMVELNRLLARAALDERAATLAVTDAQKQLRDARRSGDRSAVDHAQLQYDEAVAGLEDVRLHTQGLQKEETQRTTAGVEGSTEVQAALERQASALRDLADAQAALSTAGKGAGGVDAAAEAYAKLSVAGRQLVDVLRAIGPQWRTVQQAVQQAVFANVAGDIRRLSDVYLPVMRAQLPAIAQGWNNAFRGTAQIASTADFVADINDTLANSATMWQRVGNSYAPFLSGFRQLAVVGGQFLPSFGSWVERIANQFNRWATAARESGRAREWIANSLVVLSQLWEITKNLAGSIAAIFRAGDAGPNWLAGLVTGTQALQTFLESPAGQGKIAEVFATLRDIGSELWRVLTKVGPALLNAFSSGGAVTDTLSVFGTVTGFVADHLATFAKWLPAIIAFFIAYKALTAGAIVLETIRIPLLIAQTASNFALAGAMRATMVATGAATTTQWGLNAAMLANPIGLIIIAIVALVAGFILLWQNSAGFRDFFISMWADIWGFLKSVGNWFATDFVGFFTKSWEIMKTVFSFDFMVAALKGAVNAMIGLWNRIDFGIHIGPLPDWLPGVGGKSFNLPDLFPDLPMLESGATITRGGSAIVADRNGQGGEVVSLPRGAQVTPLSGGAGGGEVTVRLDFTGADQEFLRMFRKMVKVYGGGNVQVMAS